MSKETIIESLKQHIDTKFHDLNDWESIYNNRKDYDDDIHVYECSFVDLYLYSDGEFFTADPHIPPSFNNSSDESYSDSDSEIINILKEYVDADSYNLNDWGAIIRNSVTDNDGITRYDLSFGRLYLDKDNNYYDVEPFEVDDDVDVLTRDCTSDELSIIPLIKQYIPSKYYDLINWSSVLRGVEEVADNVYHYSLHFMDLYLDKDYKPVNYGSCYVIDDALYYDFNPDDIVTDGQLTYITSLI